MADLLSGAIVCASLIASLIFLRFWRSTGDRFFLYFALSFLIEGLNRLHAAVTAQYIEDMPLRYAIRLVAYALILLAIWEKNRPLWGHRD